MESLITMKYYEEMDDIYHRHSLINTNVLSGIEQELYDKKLYLPVYVRRFLENNYYHSPLFTEYKDKILKSRRYNSGEQVKELLEWLKQHNEYSNLLNTDVYNNLQKELHVLEKEYKEVLSLIG